MGFEAVAVAAAAKTAAAAMDAILRCDQRSPPVSPFLSLRKEPSRFGGGSSDRVAGNPGFRMLPVAAR